ncbi:hypothetical protein G9464_19300 [Halostella sp. JP-L12]|uniref:hypothetical protein n=1 Tax=Halostella TaxID=1843185 RepID=UPI000EF7B29C|nr:MULTISPECIES: hypothetical protein [Halostella]NHN49720.1 hypothetical protein [Halostella sp. JP-L12]
MTESEADDEERPFEERLEDRLMGQGVYLTNLTESDGELTIEYESIAAADGFPKRQVGRVLQMVWDAREEHGDAVSVDATVTDTDGEVIGTWRAEDEWVERLRDDELTQTEFSGKVLDTTEEK